MKNESYNYKIGSMWLKKFSNVKILLIEENCKRNILIVRMLIMHLHCNNIMSLGYLLYYSNK